jgi:hypothetical protein
MWFCGRYVLAVNETLMGGRKNHQGDDLGGRRLITANWNGAAVFSRSLDIRYRNNGALPEGSTHCRPPALVAEKQHP